MGSHRAFHGACCVRPARTSIHAGAAVPRALHCQSATGLGGARGVHRSTHHTLCAQHRPMSPANHHDSLLPLGVCRIGGNLVLQAPGGRTHALAAVAEQFGTPTFVYTEADLVERYKSFASAAAGSTQICYAVKANPSLAVLQIFARLGAGFDVVSGGEIRRVLAAGGSPEKIVFSGVGKSLEELRLALQVGVGCINLESVSEMERLSALAHSLGMQAPVSLRINPDIDAQTHPYISTGLRDNKFGVPVEPALAAYRRAVSLPGLRVVGVDCHIGSQITRLDPFLAATDRVLAFAEALLSEGISLRHIDLGGGLGIRYNNETPPSAAELMQQTHARLDAWCERLGLAPDARPHLVFEFGRALVAQAGLLLSRVECLKPASQPDAPHFAVVDAAMNDLMRPSLYEAYHAVVPVREPTADVPPQTWTIVGPICESGDWLARDRSLALAEGDLLAFASAGAYGMSMASNYNTRGKAAEVMLSLSGELRLVGERESFDDLVARELVGLS